jgi:hypothetical protein
MMAELMTLAAIALRYSELPEHLHRLRFEVACGLPGLEHEEVGRCFALAAIDRVDDMAQAREQPVEAFFEHWPGDAEVRRELHQLDVRQRVLEFVRRPTEAQRQRNDELAPLVGR